jgi:single-strand DNA-binding protein
MNLNKVILVGRLGQDPEMKYTANGHAMTTFSMATNRYWTDDSGAKQEKTEWHNIKAWRRTAEIANEFLARGSLVLVEGHIETSKYEQDGVTKYFTAIVADNIQLPPKSMGTNGDLGTPDTAAPPTEGEEETPIPF